MKTKRPSPLLQWGLFVHPGCLGRRVTTAEGQGGEEKLPMQVADTSTIGRTLLRARVAQRSLLSADFCCEASMMFCTAPALKLSRSCRGTQIPPFAIGPSKMGRDLAYNASVHSDAAGRRKYDRGDTAPAPLTLPAHSFCFSVTAQQKPCAISSREMNLVRVPLCFWWLEEGWVPSLRNVNKPLQ